MSEEKQAAAPAPGGSNKKLLLVVLGINVLMAAGIGFQAVRGQQAPAAPHAPAEEEKKPKSFGPILEVGTLIANLNGVGSGRFIKLTLHVEAADEEAKVLLEAALIPIRNESLLYLNGLTIEQGSSQPKIQELAKELRKRIEKLVGSGALKNVYFSELVIQ